MTTSQTPAVPARPGTAGRPHGTYAKYKLDGCRCYACAAETSRYNRKRERAIAYGTWRPFVDAEPVRAHVLRLRECGIGSRRLAELAGLNRSVVRDLVNGKAGKEPPARIRPGTAVRILAVEPSLENIAPATPVDATGTHRRVQALVTIGWSQSKICARLGIARTNFTAVMKAGQVAAKTALAVRELYDELWDAAPPEDNHHDRVAASRARNHARAHGWVPPMAWDDAAIDDPASVSDLGEQSDRNAALAEDSDELVRQGHTFEQAAERLGVTRDYLHKARSRVRQAVSA